MTLAKEIDDFLDANTCWAQDYPKAASLLSQARDRLNDLETEKWAILAESKE